MSLSAFAADENLMIRLRTLNIAPSESVDVDKLNGASTSAGAKVEISNESISEIDFTYFFTNNWSAELILGTATHDVAVKQVNGGTTTYSAGSVSLLPPTLLAQYHYEYGNFKPYAGLGLNYTTFYGVKDGAFKEVEYSDSMGLAYQVGFDYMIAKNLYVNLDVKKIDIKSDVDLEMYDGTKFETEVEINPTIVGLGLGMMF